MGIQIQNAAIKPAIVYDRIHLTHLEINQPTFEADANQAVYTLKLTYRHYGIVDGIRYYQSEDVNTISVDDYLTLAMTKAAAGDMTMISAMQSIEAIVASLIASETGGVASVI